MKPTLWVDPARPQPIWRGDYYGRLIHDPSWIIEPKWDGCRILIENGKCWSRQCKRLPVNTIVPNWPGTLLDGEWLRGSDDIIVWDAPIVNGQQWDAPLSERWEWVCSNLPEIGQFRRTQRLNPTTAWDRAMSLGAEGLVLKSNAPYPMGSTYKWLKVKG